MKKLHLTSRRNAKTLLMLLAMFVAGVSPAGADSVTEGFEYATDGLTVISVNSDNMGLSNGWVVVGSGNYVGITTGTSKDLQLKSGSYIYEGTYSIGTQYSNSNTWLVCPVEVSGTMEFYARQYNSSKSMIVGLATKDGDTYTISNSSFYTCSGLSSTYQKYTVALGDDPVYIAFKPSYAFFDNVTYTPYVQADGPALAVKDGSTKLTSPATYNFGLATAGTTKEFTLSNPGTEDLTVSVSETGNFGAALSATTITAGGEVTLTVTMPEATGSSAVTITPASGSGIDPFVINVSGTVRDPNKIFVDFNENAMPSTWSFDSGWSVNSTTHHATISSTAAYIRSGKIVSEGEEIIISYQGNGTTSWYSYSGYSPVLTVFTATNGNGTDAGWDAGQSVSISDNEAHTATFTIPASAKYIAIYGKYLDIDFIYGLAEPNEPYMVVTQPASLDFGIITEATAKTFTIANTGKATLEGISVASSNDIFAISDAPTSLAAGASQEVTITMVASTTGALSSDITVSATDMDNVEFTVTGTVLPDGMSKEEFTDGLPTNWTNASWTFANGIATGKSSSAYLTTPKLVVADGDLIVLKARRQDSDTSDYLTVQGSSDNGSTWTAYSKKLQSADGLTYPDFGTIVLSDIPTTVNKLRFLGYYAEIDEIWGLTYAPMLSVTQNDIAVTSPATYDFGEIGETKHVTYQFSNTGAGSIRLTSIEKDNAQFTTNWIEGAAVPFDLIITVNYDADKAGEQNCGLTVHTTEGDFVINLTSTFLAADAPKLAVSTSALDFGKVTADAVETVTVTNDGTGSMTVNIASDSEDFVVSAAQLTEIGAGESKTFDVTFKFGTPYGVKNGNITVTPTYDETAAVTITATGKAKDPDVWSEDFAAGTLPTGWEAGSNWTITDGVAKAAYAYGSTTYLTTPTLTVSDATDELTFDYTATANYVSVKIQMSKDGAAFADYKTISSLNNGDNGTYTITGLEAGDYQFRFANDDYELDNFEGFKLNLADHIAAITAYTIPASSSYTVTMKEGQSFEATVTVKEMRGVEEALTAKLYMGDEVIGTQTGTVAANGTETLTITATPTTAATDGAEMHIEVEWAGETMTTETVIRYVAAITYLTLDETSSDAITAGTYDNVTLKRKFNAGWNTVCLPFTISDVEGFFGAGAKAYEFTSYADGALSFSTVSTLTASYPYIVYVATAITEDITLNNITIASGDASAWYTRKTDSSNNAAYFRGTYAPVAAGAWTKNADTDVIYGVTADGKIQKAGSNASIKGFRAYFDLPAGATARLAFTDESNGITTVIAADELGGEAYNLKGQRVQSLKKGGLYIINGKKQVVK